MYCFVLDFANKTWAGLKSSSWIAEQVIKKFYFMYNCIQLLVILWWLHANKVCVKLALHNNVSSIAFLLQLNFQGTSYLFHAPIITRFISPISFCHHFDMQATFHFSENSNCDEWLLYEIIVFFHDSPFFFGHMFLHCFMQLLSILWFILWTFFWI